MNASATGVPSASCETRHREGAVASGIPIRLATIGRVRTQDLHSVASMADVADEAFGLRLHLATATSNESLGAVYCWRWRGMASWSWGCYRSCCGALRASPLAISCAACCEAGNLRSVDAPFIVWGCKEASSINSASSITLSTMGFTAVKFMIAYNERRTNCFVFASAGAWRLAARLGGGAALVANRSWL